MYFDYSKMLIKLSKRISRIKCLIFFEILISILFYTIVLKKLIDLSTF